MTIAFRNAYKNDTAADVDAIKRTSSGGTGNVMAHQPSIKSAAALAEFAANAAQAIAQGKTPSDYTLAMIQKHAGELCGCDPSEDWADLIAEFDAADEAEAQRIADENRRNDALSFKSMVGWQ